MNELNLLIEGVIRTQDRTFTQLVGGFGEDKPILTTKQIAELMGYDVKVVNQTINRNIEEFKKDDGFLLDLKEVTLSDHNLETLKHLGYTKMAISKAKNIYALSQAGFLLYLKFAEGENAVSLYKYFIEDYFKTKAENKMMKETIEQTIEKLKEEKAMLIGKTIMASNETERIEIMTSLESKNSQILELEKSISEKELIKKLTPQMELANIFKNSKNSYDVGKLAKVLSVSGFGRNKLFDWMRDEKLLMKDNTPYQQHMKYFTVIPVISGNYTTYKTLVKPEGVEYIMKRLIKSGKVVAKSVEDVLMELEAI